MITMLRLKDKVAIVTGTSSGIGKATAQLFAREGAKVVTASRAGKRAELTVKEICDAGGTATYVPCDISVEGDVINAIQTAIKTYGRLDIIVNNAGVNFAKPFEETTTADWDYVMNIDLRGTFFFCRYGIIEMLKTGGGSIVNITSVHTLQCHPEAALYDAAKWGTVGMTKALATEFAARNIRINSLAPGLIDTAIWDDLLNAAEDPEECKKYWKANIPQGRPGTPEETANAIMFLASDEASYFNGANVVMDGGMTALLVSNPDFKYKSVKGREVGGS